MRRHLMILCVGLLLVLPSSVWALDYGFTGKFNVGYDYNDPSISQTIRNFITDTTGIRKAKLAVDAQYNQVAKSQHAKVDIYLAGQNVHGDLGADFTIDPQGFHLNAGHGNVALEMWLYGFNFKKAGVEVAVGLKWGLLGNLNYTNPAFRFYLEAYLRACLDKAKVKIKVMGISKTFDVTKYLTLSIKVGATSTVASPNLHSWSWKAGVFAEPYVKFSFKVMGKEFKYTFNKRYTYEHTIYPGRNEALLLSCR